MAILMPIYRPNLLSALPEPLLSRLFADSSQSSLAPDQALFGVGDLGNGCYKLKHGLLKVVVSSPLGEARIVCVLGSGAIVGELSMIDGLPRSASVIAISDCELQFVSRERFDKFIKDNPEIRDYLLRTLASRLRDADEALAAATFLSVKGRVARALLELAEHVGQDNGDGRILLNHKISQADLAAMAGVARENVSRTLSDWQRRNLVVRSANYYYLNDSAALRREMDFDA
jgi:CRP/FNR family cyclic AMP-dependent transcriptional regulator